MPARHTLFSAFLLCLASLATAAGLAAQDGEWKSAAFQRLPSHSKLAVAAVGTWELPRTVKGFYRDQAGLMVDQIQAGRIAAAEATWTKFCSYYFHTGTRRDLDVIVRWIIREGYLAPRQEEKYWLDKCRYFHQLADVLADQVAQLDGLADFPRHNDRSVRVPEVRLSWEFREDRSPVLLRRSATVTQAELKAALAVARKDLERARSEAEQAAGNLLKRAEKDQAVLNQVSELAQKMYSTALAAISKSA